MRRLRFDRVIAFTLGAALLCAVVGLIVLARTKDELVRATHENYKQQQSLIASQIADMLSNNFVNVENQLRIMATMPEVQDYTDTERCNAKLGELLQVNQKQLGNLGRVDEQGTFVCSVNAAIIGQPAGQYGDYVPRLIADPEHRTVIGRLNKPAGTDNQVIPLHVPVYRDGVFGGTLGGALYFSDFQNNFLRSVRLGNNGHAVIMDDNGDILYHPSKEQSGKNLLDPKILGMFEPQATMRNLVQQVKAGKSGSFEYRHAGTVKIGVYKTFQVPNTTRNWSVIVTIPAEDLDIVARQAGIDRIFLALLALFTIVTGLLTFVSLRNIYRDREIQRIKDDFISITSHQLRTPATIVKQNLGIIRDGFAREEERDSFIDGAYISNENQLSIIENILNVSKLEAGRLKLHKEPVDLVTMIRKLADSMKLGIKARNHKLKLDLPKTPVRLQADSTKLCMALENLLSNAVKYTPPGGSIVITVRQEGSQAVVMVRDTGQGIASHELPQLFQRFYRLHGDETSHVPGTGLGLYLTKKIVELHGGSISAESRLKRGTTFTVHLPSID